MRRLVMHTNRAPDRIEADRSRNYAIIRARFIYLFLRLGDQRRRRIHMNVTLSITGTRRFAEDNVDI